jgi:hypothetical protein
MFRRPRVAGSMTLLMLAISVLVFAADTYAETIMIGPLKNANRADVSSVSAECEMSRDGRQMTCSFVQTRVDLRKTPEDAQAELEKQLRETAPHTKMSDACRDRKGLTESEVRAADVAPRLKTFLLGMVQRLNAMCNVPTTETVREFLTYVLQKETKTCRIWTNPWSETFTKQPGDKWVSNRGPGGICGVVTVSTLESKPIDPKNPNSLVRLWIYETQRVVTNRIGPLCQFDETRIRYSWDAKDFDRVCDFVEF